MLMLRICCGFQLWGVGSNINDNIIYTEIRSVSRIIYSVIRANVSLMLS